MGYIPSSYLPTLLLYDSGLSVTASTANTNYTLATINIPRNGIMFMSMIGHVSAGIGSLAGILNRGGTNYSLGFSYDSVGYSSSLFGNTGTYNTANYISFTTPELLFVTGNLSQTNTGATSGASPSLILPVYTGDQIQIVAMNNTANDIVYLDSIVVMLI